MNLQASLEGAGAYAFDDFVLDVERRALLRGNEPVPLTPKAFETLVALVRRAGQLTSKDELLAAVWPDTFIEEATLAQNVFTVRRALGSRRDGGQFIETVPRHGYRFACEVRPLPAPPRMTEHDASAPARSSSDAPVAVDWRLPRPIGTYRPTIFVGLALVGLLAAVVAAIGARGRPEALATAPFRPEHLEQLTVEGTARQIAVSGDGRYVAYVREERNGAQGLWLRQSSVSAVVSVVPPEPAHFGGVTFSPDGRSLLYTRYEHDRPVGALYEVPVLGGVPRRIVVDADSPPAVSPDGSRVAFVRIEPARHSSALLLADRDGSNLRVLARRQDPEFFSIAGPAWSPDGETIACAVGARDGAGRYMTVWGISVTGGTAGPLTDRRWGEVGQAAWLGRSRRLVVDAWDREGLRLAKTLWEVAVPSGAVRRLVHDLADYNGVGATADGTVLVSIQRTYRTALWVAPLAAIDRAERITSGAGDPYGGALGMSWLADGRIVYGSVASGSPDLWLLESDGRGRRQLTVDPAPEHQPNAAPDGGSAVFVSWRSGDPHVWEIDLATGAQRQLTRGRSETYPVVSRDGRSLIYVAMRGDGRPTLWRAARDGSNPVQMMARSASFPALSPDGASLAVLMRERIDVPPQIGILSLGGSKTLRTFEVPLTLFAPAGLQWTPDGSAVVYVDTSGEVSNLVRQPLAGGAPQRLTDFDTERIFRFAISPDGRLAFERGTRIDDVVLLSASPIDVSSQSS